MTQAAIEIEGVAKRFGENQVLRDMSLRVTAGQTFAFLGRNAAGKTTTIRMLLGLLQPDGGSIRVLGLDPTRCAMEVRKQVGYLAENQTMYGWMTVDQLIRFVAPFYPTWDHSLAGQYVKQFELPLDQRVRHLSKGQNVRLGLLLALAHRPALVILDDPALGLDPIMRKEFNRALITNLQGEGQTVFYSSHLLNEVEPVADVVAILDQGVIRRLAPTETLRADVKRFIFRAEAYDRLEQPLPALDVCRSDDEVAVTVDSAPETLARLAASDCEYRVVDLNLDEIFEAYVVGHPDGIPPGPESSAAMVGVS
jgi:ABC-2 type transport system ATP-binding protein